jgi:nucleoside phosphorylase
VANFGPFHDSGTGSLTSFSLSNGKIEHSELSPTPPHGAEEVLAGPSELRGQDRMSYKIGWLCALHSELAASIAMLDEQYERLPQLPAADTNSYTLGRIGPHNIVIAPLPSGETGSNSAAHVASNMLWSFRQLRFGFIVGIGGGIPNPKYDIRLGDIVVGKPYEREGGVYQYDLGRRETDKFVKIGSLNAPPTVLRTTLTTVRAEHTISGTTKLLEYISPASNPKVPSKFAIPEEEDILFKSDNPHVEDRETCDLCDKTEIVERKTRSFNGPFIHYGTIGSGNQVIKDPDTRDRLWNENGVVCVEMEAAGVMNIFPCLVIRGISDYSDSHKNLHWRNYASTTAAAYCKEFLRFLPTTAVETIF